MIESQTYDYKGYRIVVMNKQPIFQAAIYPILMSLPLVNWTRPPIEAPNVRAAELLARQRIDKTLAKEAA